MVPRFLNANQLLSNTLGGWGPVNAMRCRVNKCREIFCSRTRIFGAMPMHSCRCESEESEWRQTSTVLRELDLYFPNGFKDVFRNQAVGKLFSKNMSTSSPLSFFCLFPSFFPFFVFLLENMEDMEAQPRNIGPDQPVACWEQISKNLHHTCIKINMSAW